MSNEDTPNPCSERELPTPRDSGLLRVAQKGLIESIGKLLGRAMSRLETGRLDYVSDDLEDAKDLIGVLAILREEIKCMDNPKTITNRKELT